MKTLLGHTEENPFLIEDYPYGFKLRTQMRVWIESQPKKGDRYCTQTVNPKNGRLNKPNKSTYQVLSKIVKGDDGKVFHDAINVYSSREKVQEFISDMGGVEGLNPIQKTMFNGIMGIREVKVDEFTGEAIKDYSFKWRKRHTDNQPVILDITFDRVDGVQLKEIYLAVKSVDQDKLKDMFLIDGSVRVFVRGGRMLGNVTEESYNEFLASDFVAGEV